jgi:S-adenosylmethionine hydrolase
MITLTTDFGLQDPYVSEMKAIILSICTNARIVDITHSISKFNIRMGAFILASASKYFPKNTIHVAVVDPGVGVSRVPLLIETKKSFFIGPDNGLLVLAAKKQGIKRIFELRNADFMLKKISNTFHGRDIFAPVAAHLLNGINPTLFGPQVSKLAKPIFTEITRTPKFLIGEVLHVDGFGNVITNIHIDDFTQNPYRKMITVATPTSKLVLRFCKSYSETKLGELLVLIGSHGFLEISANQNNAAVLTKIQPGDKIVISIP